MPFMYIQGRVDVRTYKELCQNNGFDAEEKKCVFIFPGNSSHHALGSTLFSVKAGGGLAAASAAIGTAGYPTLSLPTTSMEQWSANSRQQQIVHGALVDLYKALGAGYQLILPVREHEDTRYFDYSLDSAEFPLEPSFWGGIQAAANKPLANHYIKELNALSLFMSLSSEERDKQRQTAQTNPLYQAYAQGQTMVIDDPWLVGAKKAVGAKVPPRNPIADEPVLTPKVAVKKETEVKESPVVVQTRNTTADESVLTSKLAVKPIAEDREPPAEKSKAVAHAKPYIAPSSRAAYEKYYGHSSDALSNARDLLDNYTAHNSMLMRFFTGHWNRHHVLAINQLVEQIDKKQITDVADLVKQLKEIQLVNPNGSLARRIRFIEEKNPAKTNPDEPTAPSVSL